MILGVTGGMGSGKTLVAGVLQVLGAAVFDSDKAAKMAYYLPDVRAKVLDLLGSKAYTSENQINRHFISSMVFSDTQLLHELNAILHPAVKHMMKTFVNAHAGQLVVKESALLFEAGLEREVDKVLVVTAPDELRIARCMARDQLTKEQVIARMKKQMPQEQKVKRADFVITNDDVQAVLPQVLKIMAHLGLKTHA